MPNRIQFIRQTAAVLLACGLFVGLLPGFAAAQDLSTQAARAARAGAIVPLDGPVLAGKPVTFKLSGKPSNPHWDFGDGATADGSSVTHTYQKPGIHRVVMGSKVGDTFNELSSAIVRVHTPETLHLPQVLLDTDARNEVDDQHYIAYGLFSNLDVLGINSIHNVPRPDNGRSEQRNYDEILHIIQLSRRSGLLKHRPENLVPQAFRGAKMPLEVPASGNWSDTQPVKSEASKAILAAARGASPDNPVWVLPVGPCTNVASAILLASEEGLDLKSRIKIVEDVVAASGASDCSSFRAGCGPPSVGDRRPARLRSSYRARRNVASIGSRTERGQASGTPGRRCVRGEVGGFAAIPGAGSPGTSSPGFPIPGFWVPGFWSPGLGF